MLTSMQIVLGLIEVVVVLITTHIVMRMEI